MRMPRCCVCRRVFTTHKGLVTVIVAMPAPAAASMCCTLEGMEPPSTRMTRLSLHGAAALLQCFSSSRRLQTVKAMPRSKGGVVSRSSSFVCLLDESQYSQWVTGERGKLTCSLSVQVSLEALVHREVHCPVRQQSCQCGSEPPVQPPGALLLENLCEAACMSAVASEQPARVP